MQVPTAFEYVTAASAEEAIALLARHGPEARVVAGGHSLIPMMKLRIAAPETLVDINGVEELRGISLDLGEVEPVAADPALKLGVCRNADLVAVGLQSLS